jgi:hypothetical protein
MRISIGAIGTCIRSHAVSASAGVELRRCAVSCLQLCYGMRQSAPQQLILILVVIVNQPNIDATGFRNIAHGYRTEMPFRE